MTDLEWDERGFPVTWIAVVQRPCKGCGTLVQGERCEGCVFRKYLRKKGVR